MANSPTDPLAGRIAIGFVIQAAGAYLALVADDELLVLAGWLVVSFGAIVALIGAIGWGILAGFRARERDTRS